MTSKNLLIELGVEELPPKQLSELAGALLTNFFSGMQKEGYVAADASEATHAQGFATPRRLAVRLQNVACSQPERFHERMGPPLKAAVDATGKPTQVGLGFARSVGVNFEELGQKDSGRGPCLYYAATIPGKPLEELCGVILEAALSALPIKKRMRWSDKLYQFVRPVHWLVALYGDQVLPIEVLGLKSDRLTRGHRFLAPGSIALATGDAYEQTLQDVGFVIPSFHKRRERIREQILACAPKGTNAAIDEDLLDEVAGLVEWPRAYVGRFDPGFLEVPHECLVSAMKEHQKYFPLYGLDQQLIPQFIMVANLDSKDPSHVIAGNEKVIAPRLADARFFFEQDKKTGIKQFRERLATVVFQEQLGTIFAKTERIAEHARSLAQGLGLDPLTVGEAAQLCKADLASGMVYEFTHLQGIMGRYYAHAAGLDAKVADAIMEHYWPRFAGDQIPRSDAGRIVALADKLDTIVGMFGIGKPPTGSKDPYSLRRLALGVLRILIEGQLDLSLKDLVTRSLDCYPKGLMAVGTLDETVGFILERIPAKYKDDGVPMDTVAAVAALGIDAPLDFHRRVLAVTKFRDMPEAPALAAANKRVKNILKDLKDDDFKELSAKEKLDLEKDKEPAELGLNQAITEQVTQLSPLLQKRDYTAALSQLARLKSPVDRFFEEVKVMDDDPFKRRDRLHLLVQLQQLFSRVADISLLQ